LQIADPERGNAYPATFRSVSEETSSTSPHPESEVVSAIGASVDPAGALGVDAGLPDAVESPARPAADERPARPITPISSNAAVKRDTEWGGCTYHS